MIGTSLNLAMATCRECAVLCTHDSSKFRSQNRTGNDTVRFIGVAITQVELRFETEHWAACENANVNIACKIVLVLNRMQ